MQNRYNTNDSDGLPYDDDNVCVCDHRETRHIYRFMQIDEPIDFATLNCELILFVHAVSQERL